MEPNPNPIAPESGAPLSEDTAQELLQALRHKQGGWLDWGRLLQQLHKGGRAPQTIFEETGFEPIHQNQLAVAAQVFSTLDPLSDATRSRLLRDGSEIVYELRQLDRERRAGAAEAIVTKQLDILGAREVVKAVKDFSRRSHLPTGFTDTPGDAVAFQYWQSARGKKTCRTDRERSRGGFSLPNPLARASRSKNFSATSPSSRVAARRSCRFTA
ncbi:RuBisCO accumulation factor 1 [Rubidibacter lacunae]|uniref:RuBisCO accumulation factor 1 n=1 Tax=Rubidibacter lacunae TaxID=582514 RepID=UPI00040E7424